MVLLSGGLQVVLDFGIVLVKLEGGGFGVDGFDDLGDWVDDFYNIDGVDWRLFFFM